MVLRRVKIAFALGKDDARVAVVLLRFAAQNAPSLLLAHAGLASEGAQFFHALVAHALRAEQQPLRQLRARGHQRQRGKQPQRVAVRQLARVWLQFRHSFTSVSISLFYYTLFLPKKRG